MRIPGNQFVTIFVCASVTIAVLFSSLMLSNWTKSGMDVPAVQANQSIHQPFQIPLTAKNVRFVSNPRLTKVCFNVSPATFEAWASLMKFETRPITADKPESSFTIVSRDQVDSLTTTAGVHFNSRDQCGISGVFDFGRELCSALFECK